MDDVATCIPKINCGIWTRAKLSEAIKRNRRQGFFPEQFIGIKFRGRVCLQKQSRWKEYFTERMVSDSNRHPSLDYPLLLGTLWVSLGAILLALPFQDGCCNISGGNCQQQGQEKFLNPFHRTSSGHSLGCLRFFRPYRYCSVNSFTFNLPVGETALAGSIVLAIMALPTIITVAEDAMRTTPLAMKESSLALGATHWQTIYKVIIPYALSGIMAELFWESDVRLVKQWLCWWWPRKCCCYSTWFTEPVRTIRQPLQLELGEASMGVCNTRHYSCWEPYCLYSIWYKYLE